MKKPSENNLSQAMQSALTLGLEYLDDISNYTFILERKKILPIDFVQKHCILPLSLENDHYIIAASDPFAIDVFKEVDFLLKKPSKQVIVKKAYLQEVIEAIYNSEEDYKSLVESEKTLNLSENLLQVDKEYDLLQQSKSSSVVTLLNNILLQALRCNASDIHFEPVDKNLIVKYRIDGLLFEKYVLPKSLESQVIARLKVQAELDIAETRLPQDGRIKLKMGKKEIDFRVSTVPVVFGERLVLRIHDSSNIILGLDKLDLSDLLLNSLRNDIRKTQGIILITGPTGSGKTTTLISALSEIAGNELNIMTIEDPVEYKLKNMAQINVNHKRKLGFATGLKHILRQDPDVIMVGEIRDKETVDIAIEASLTGHLVLSTLHTNDAPSTIIRLIEMGIEPYLISSSLISICSQRLVRKICTKCNNDPHLKKSCNQCFKSGYKGRRGIYEYLKITPEIQKMILEKCDSNSLKILAKKQGMKSLYEDGLYYVERNITTLEEIQRVTHSSKENL